MKLHKIVPFIKDLNYFTCQSQYNRVKVNTSVRIGIV